VVEYPQRMDRGIGMTVGMTFKANHPATWPFSTAVFGLIKLLLGKRSHEQPQAFELLGVQDPVEQLYSDFRWSPACLGHILRNKSCGSMTVVSDSSRTVA
jgi:hypothetical protein